MTNTSETPPERLNALEKVTFSWHRLWPLAIVVLGFVSFFAFGLDDYVSFEALRANHVALAASVERSYVLAVALYMLAYVAVVAFSFPGATLMSIVGGFLFGWVAGTIYIVVGATTGATLLFLAAKTALGEPLRARATGFIRKLEDGFRDNALNYLLFLRLVPLFPFWIVNLVPAFTGVELRTFVIATFIGIIPGAAVYASVGHGLDSVFASGGNPDLMLIFEPQFFLPFLALALLSLVPVAYKKLRKIP